MFQHHPYLVRAALCRLIVLYFMPLLYTDAYSNNTDNIDREYEAVFPWNVGEYILQLHLKINLKIVKSIESPTFKFVSKLSKPV